MSRWVQQQQLHQQATNSKDKDSKTKKKDTGMKARNILREPTEEEEQLTVGSNRLWLRGSASTSSSCSHNINVISSSTSLDASDSMSGQSTIRLSRSNHNNSGSNSNNNTSKNAHRNSNLSSLLSILFGSFMLANLILLSQTATVTDSSKFTSSFAGLSTNLTFSISPLQPANLSASTSTRNPNEATTLGSRSITVPLTTESITSETTTIELTTVADEEESSKNVAPTSNTVNEEDEPELPATPSTSGSPRAALVDVGGSVADLLVERLGSRGQPSEDGAGDSNGVEVSEKTEKEEEVITEPTSEKNLPLNSTEEQLRLAMETYERWKATGDDLIELFSRKMLPLVIEHGYEVDAGTVGGLLQVFNGIRALKPWALKLLDASAKITPGLLVGTQADFGDFDECLNVRSDDPSGLATPEALSAEPDPVTGLRPSTLVGRYCIADVEFPKPPRIPLPEGSRDPERGAAGFFAPIELRTPLLNFSESTSFKETIFVETANFFHMLYVDPIRVGLCLTNKIEPEHFAALLNKLVEHFRVRINFHGRCVSKYDNIQWTIQQRVSAWILGVTCALVALSTLLDVLHHKLGKLPLPEMSKEWQMPVKIALAPHRPLFTSFSIIHNTRRLFSAPRSYTRMSEDEPRQHLPAPESLSSARNSIEGGSSSESESSPSIERRSSLTSSALHLIGASSTGQPGANDLSSQKRMYELNLQFQQMQASSGDHKQANQTNLLCLHGIRVITMTWMIVNHTYLFGGFFVLWAHRRLIDIAEWPKSISFQLVLNGWLTVETYFFLSALIIVLNVMPLMKARKFTYFSYVIHRLIRLLPAYIGLVSLNFLWPLISSGPVWLVKGRSFIQTPCENYLWTNFLFINNWIWPEKQCMVHTWFLSADFQLYLLAPMVVFLLSRRPVFGHSVNILVAVAASIFSGFIIYANKLMPTTLINKLEFDSIKQQLSYSYFATYQHMGPYCLGIFIGYLLHKRPQVHLPKHLTWLLWLLLPPLSFTTLLLTYLWNGAYADPNLISPTPLVSAVYVAIHRTIWTSLLAWIVFACTTGRAKIMSDFLSHSIFIPFSRLSFSIYLVHLPVIMFRALNLRHTIEWTDTNILWEACGNFVVSAIVGYFVNIAFESPITNLEHVIFRRTVKGNEQVDDKAQVQRGYNLAKRNLSLALADSINEAKPAAQNILKPQSSVSKTSRSESTDESDNDNKSAIVNLVDRSGSRKLSDLAGTGSTSIDSHEMPWKSGKELDQYNMRNPLCSYNQASGSQMEPQSLSDGDEPFDSATSDRLPLPSGILEQQQMAAPTPNLSRYSSFLHQKQMEKIKLNELDQMNNDEGEKKRVLPQIHHNSNSLSRPTQYVTLARTSRLDHNDLMLDLNSTDLYVNHSAAKVRDHHKTGQISRLTNHNSSSSTSSSYLEKQRTHLINRRQGRYNTLTGTGAQELRLQHERQQKMVMDNNWRMQGAQVFAQQANETRVAISEWLTQPTGLKIPRIDSSTLRRFKRNGGAGSSIVEEPSIVERSEM